MMASIGDTIGKRYRVMDIHLGGMGIVYVCYDYEWNKFVVLKTFQDRLFRSDKVQNNLKSEALIWTELDRYPYIVHAYGVEILDGRLFIKLEYVAPDNHNRNTLTHYLGCLRFSDILKIAIKCCYGMKYAYSKGVLAHRDIKPDNIMITANMIAKLTDFGLATAFQDMPSENLNSTHQRDPSLSIFKSRGHSVCGTLPYMAPEQFDGKVDMRSDMYSFGIVLFRMVTDGKYPFTGRTPQEWEECHRKARVPAIFSPLLPIITKCLKKDPCDRYQNFFFLKEDLQERVRHYTGRKFVPVRVKQPKVQEIFSKGVTLSRLGKYEEALICLFRVTSIDPECIEAWRWIGWNLSVQNKYEDAITIYDKAIEKFPKLVELLHFKGFLLSRLRRYEECIDCYQKALKMNPNIAGVWYNLGFVLYRLKQYKKAIECFDKVIVLNPTIKKAYKMKEKIIKITNFS